MGQSDPNTCQYFFLFVRYFAKITSEETTRNDAIESPLSSTSQENTMLQSPLKTTEYVRSYATLPITKSTNAKGEIVKTTEGIKG